MNQTKPLSSSKKAPGGMGTLFERENLVWMAIGIAVMIIGFFLMAGGRSADPNVFNRDEVYSARRITLAPIVILAGLVVVIFGIFRGPKSTSPEA